MFDYVGMSELPALRDYLQQYYAENILLLNDLRRRGAFHHAWTDDLLLSGYRRGDELQAVQGFYRFGRWMPHFAPDAGQACVDRLLEEMQRRRALGKRLGWILGARRVVDPILSRLGPRVHVGYDERDYLLYVDAARFVATRSAVVRRAGLDDQDAIAELRIAFEAEYFHVPARQINRDWCYHTARRYISEGTYVAERDGNVVSMVAVEAAIPELVQVGAVYTAEPYRNQGLAKAVVSAICQEYLAQVPRVTLTVRTDNAPALRVYRGLGFSYWLDYRMTRLR